MEKITLILSKDDMGQLIDGIREHRTGWERTWTFLEHGIEPEEGYTVFECSDACEAHRMMERYNSLLDTMEAAVEIGR